MTNQKTLNAASLIIRKKLFPKMYVPNLERSLEAAMLARGYSYTSNCQAGVYSWSWQKGTHYYTASDCDTKAEALILATSYALEAE